MENEIVNKVEQSVLESLDLSVFYPDEKDILEIDIKKYLFMELIIKEKELREQLKQEDFSQFSGKYIRLFCSVDAIIPKWVYMLFANYLTVFAKGVYVGTKTEAREFFFIEHFLKHLQEHDYTNKRIVLKGCGEGFVSEQAYFFVTSKLLLKVKSIFYGEPCSTVPIFKKNKC